MTVRACIAAVLAAAAALWLMSGTQRERSLLAATAAPESMRALEAAVATRPGDAPALCALAQSYLDAHQPGLAVVLVEGAPALARADVRVQHVFARALVDEGRGDEALAVENGVVSACRPLVEGSVTPEGCDPVLLASAIRRAGILRELVSLGVQDAQAHPEETKIAYQNATREARVMVQ